MTALDRPTSLDDLTAHERPVTAAMAAAQLGIAVQTVRRWARTGRLQPFACLVQTRAPIYRWLDVLHAEQAGRHADNRSRQRVA